MPVFARFNKFVDTFVLSLPLAPGDVILWVRMPLCLVLFYLSLFSIV